MFKWLLENSLGNRLLVIIGSLVLMAYGAFTLSRTPVDVFPDLNKPTVTIMTEAGGMAAEEVEQLISFPLETTMNGLPGVESVRSVVQRWPVLHLRHLRLVHGNIPCPADGVGATVVDGRRPAFGRHAADGPDQLDHGRNHADRHSRGCCQDFADAGARIRRLGAAAAAAGNSGSWRKLFPSAAKCVSSKWSPIPCACPSWGSRTISWRQH